MRPTLPWLAPPTALVILACGGMASGPSEPSEYGITRPAPEDGQATTEAALDPTLDGTAVRAYLIADSRVAWPTADLDQHAVRAADDDLTTAWEAPAGAMAAWFTPSVQQVQGVQIMGRGPVEVRLLVKPEKGAPHYATTPWIAARVAADQLAGTALSADGVVQGLELRLPEGGALTEVRLIAEDGFEPSPSGAWTYYGTRRTSPDLTAIDDPAKLRFGTFDPEACSGSKVGGGPDEHLTATCSKAEGGVAVKGAFPPFGAIDEVVSIVEIHACLAIVDGFPMSRKGCRKKP